MTFMVAVVALTGMFTVGDNKASAASTIKQVTMYNFTDVVGSISTSEDSYYVNVSLTNAPHPYGLRQKWDWTMSLQRYTNGAWTTIGTKTGYVTSSSPSHRSFSNIAVKGAKMRVKVTYTPYYYAIYTDGTEGWRNDSQSGGSFTHYSNTWTR